MIMDPFKDSNILETLFLESCFLQWIVDAQIVNSFLELFE